MSEGLGQRPAEFNSELARLNCELNDPARTALQSLTVCNEVSYPGYLLNITGKALKTHEAIVILAERGFGQDAGLLVRSLLNLLIDALWMAKDPCPRFEVWVDYDWILRERFPLPPERAAENKVMLDTKVTLDTINKEAKRVRTKHGYKSGTLRWTPKFGQVAKRESRS